MKCNYALINKQYINDNLFILFYLNHTQWYSREHKKI